jgi:opacity protein-like surface antigen
MYCDNKRGSKLVLTKLVLMLLAGLISSATYAAPNADYPTYEDSPSTKGGSFSEYFASHYVVTISGGPGWMSNNDQQTIAITPQITRTYSNNTSPYAIVQGELFIGLHQMINQRIQTQLGFEAATTTNGKITGNIWDDANPQFNNYEYNYLIRHTQIGLQGKLLADVGLPGLVPFIVGTVGVGFNNARSFWSQPTIPQAVPIPGFSNNTTTTFTYSIGVGLQHQYNDNWFVGLEYAFADWGKSQLGIANNQTTGNGLVIRHLYTNNILLNLSYIA